MILKLCNNGLSVVGTREDGATVSYSIEAEEYKKWLADGNTPLPEFTEAELTAKAYEEAMNTWKSNRQAQVDAIEVTLDTVIYQGDELSQTRMTRAITALPDDVVTVPWVAKDNTVHQLTRVELKGLLFQAGLAQSNIWSLGRPIVETVVEPIVVEVV